MYTLLMAAALGAPAPAEECSPECATEFLTGCLRHHCDGDAAAAYAQCRSEVDGAVGPLAGVCAIGCADTAAMAASEQTGCDGGGGDDDEGVSEGGECGSAVLVRPTVPTACAAENRGCCSCAPDGTTFVWWIQNLTVQRCLHTYNVPEEGAASPVPVPVLLSMGGYGGGSIGQEAKAAARRFGFAVFGLGSTSAPNAAGFRLAFGNGGVANTANPTPCSAAENRDREYTDAVFDLIAARPALFDPARIFAEGFSQNSMYAAYVTVCYADRMAGVWQGGSGLARTGWAPTTPGMQGQCSEASFAEHGRACCDAAFCDECEFWPLWPRTCGHKVVDCIASYTDDAIACGTDHLMFEAMVAEGNDARLLSFAPTATGGGHRSPENAYSWKVGCLGLAEQCNAECAASFAACVAALPAGEAGEAFAACDAQMDSLPGCTETCAPTLDMLRLSEAPVVSLSEGRFGTASDLPVAPVAPAPACTATYGPIPDGQSCSAAGSPLPEPMPPCGTTSATTSTGAGYIVAPDGRCPDGTAPIFDEAECAAAAAELALFDGAPATTTRRNRPAGCYLRRDALWWAPRGSFSLDDPDRTAVCAAVAPAAYELMAAGRCADGLLPIVTRLECEYAAHRLALPDIRAWQQDKAGRATGCSLNENGNLIFNTAGDPAYDDPRRLALCSRPIY